jgi:16S rRNA pseudouridine516 synthase
MGPPATDATLVRMRISQILFSQGLGSRRDCATLLRSGVVQVADRTVYSADEDFATEGLVFVVQGQPWSYQAEAMLMLHKPAGYECSREPRHHAGVMNLLPAPLQRRGVQPVGRLDQDTTGLLLLTDVGVLIHRLTSPRHHVPKVYEVGTKHEVDEAQVAALLAGVVLHDDPLPARAVACTRTASHALQLTLIDGRYHQVKRMLAAVGNRVETLHRSAFGSLTLPPDLAPGGWRWLSAAERQALSAPAAAALPPAPPA